MGSLQFSSVLGQDQSAVAKWDGNVVPGNTEGRSFQGGVLIQERFVNENEKWFFFFLNHRTNKTSTKTHVLTSMVPRLHVVLSNHCFLTFVFYWFQLLFYSDRHWPDEITGPVQRQWSTTSGNTIAKAGGLWGPSWSSNIIALWFTGRCESLTASYVTPRDQNKTPLVMCWRRRPLFVISLQLIVSKPDFIDLSL